MIVRWGVINQFYPLLQVEEAHHFEMTLVVLMTEDGV